MVKNVETEHLRRFGENVALSLPSSNKCSGRIVEKNAAKDLERVRSAAKELREKASEAEREWLRDNYYVAERAASFVRECFSRKRALPSSAYGHVPLVYGAAESFVFCGKFSEERLDEYLTGFQSVRPLNERELSLLFPALHAALLKKLSQAASRASELSEKAAERAAHEENAREIKEVFDAFKSIAEADAAKLLLKQSTVERIMSADPVYRDMDEENRAQYRRRLARLAGRKGVS
ncbi:MAG: hypothetical protein IKS88_00960, partial [Clostridia bacterium]|nr:hypothetical protein [Clostridia bacterium]